MNNKDNINTFENNKNEDFELNISVENKLQVNQDLRKEDQPQLGDFDDTFTWSAEVLAAQGKKIDQFSLDDIDWLSRLKQGLEKTRKGFVTDLLDKLGDDPLTPEVLDDLETLLRAGGPGTRLRTPRARYTYDIQNAFVVQECICGTRYIHTWRTNNV